MKFNILLIFNVKERFVGRLIIFTLFYPKTESGIFYRLYFVCKSDNTVEEDIVDLVKENFQFL